MSASSAFVLMWAGWASRRLVHAVHEARRRADLGGVFRFIGLPERAVRVVAADAARSMKEGVRSVGVNVDFHSRLDEMGPHRALRDLELQRPVGDAIVMADLALLLDAQDLAEVDAGDRREGRAFAGPSTAKRALWAGR
jgi:hypothetical protein